MRRTITIYVYLLFCISGLMAQPFDYGNNWYKTDPDRPYVKLIVDTDGIYRVSAADLQTAGYNLAGVNLNTLRLYYRGAEVPIFVSTATNGSLNFVEFFGQRNDGREDSIFYRDPVTGLHKSNLQPNREISLFTDESAYFLTWGGTPSANRYFSNLDPTYSLYTPEPHYRYESRLDYHPKDDLATYVQGGGGSFDAFYTLNCDYGTGEGYMGPRFEFNKPRTVSLATPQPASTSNPIKVQTRVFGRSRTQHFLRVELNNESNNPVVDTTINTSIIYIKTYRRDFVPGNALTDQTDLTFYALRPNTDNNHVAWSSIEYDRLPDLEGDSTTWVKSWDKPGKARIQFSNVSGDDTVFVYDQRNRFRNIGLINNGTAEVIVQGFGNTRDLYVSTDRAIRKPRLETPRLAKLHSPAAGAEYVIVSHRNLAISAQAYANYRDTATVSPVNSVKIVYVDEIYDEYGYGSITPWAIKRFCKDAIDNWQTKPRFFLLWGKGRFRTREADPNEALVPTFGFPATDFEFVSHFDQQSFEIKPEVAIGRVNVFTNDEGLSYLDKVNTYEHTPWESWMKEGVFLGGGGTLGEQNAIRGAFNYMIGFFKGRPFGGFQHYFQKDDTDVIFDPSDASYHTEISEGTSIIHFFGHSTSNILDVNLREPFEYNNFRRFPLMIAMGCYGGDFTVGKQGNESFGERWVKQPQRGAIAYLGNSSAGYLNPLRDYGRVMYRYLHSDMLGQPLGEVIRQTLTAYSDSLIGIQYRNHGRQMNLQGDPALILYNIDQPDLEISETSVFFTPENFTAQDDSFAINIIVKNNGLVVNDSFHLTIQQRLPNNTVFVHPPHDLPVVSFQDTFTYILDNPAGNEMTGQNFFDIFVDAKNRIDEYNENNNRFSASRAVPGNIPAILYPTEYSVIGESQAKLQASAFFMTQDEGVGYIFEIDTVSTFDSPLKANSGLVSGNSTLVNWDIPFSLLDSTVYFWRVRLANVSPSVWARASFKFIANENGWAQDALEQFSRNFTERIKIEPLQKAWVFEKFGIQYEFSTRRNGGFVYARNGSQEVDLLLNDYNADAVAYMVLDQLTLEPKLSSAGLGPLGAVAVDNELFKLKNAVLNTSPGDYFMLASHKNAKVHTWTQDIFDALKLVGVSENLSLLQDGDPFVILGRKGYPNSATEVYTPTGENKFVLNTILLSAHEEGKITSTQVGPALNWDELFWKWDSQDPVVQESMELSVYGVRFDKTDSLLFSNLNAGTYDLSQIDADEFPYLKLLSVARDTATRTAPQLDHWHVFFEPAPDAVVDPITNFEFRSDTIYEGQDVFIHMGARNISNGVMDSLKVRLLVEREDRTRIVMDSARLAPLLPNGPSVEFEFGFNSLSKNLSGDVSLIVELNPDGEIPERHLFNNQYVQPFHVVVDNENPVMDITFDGKHIIDGDIVSPNPEILVEVNDENRFVAIDDTAAFELRFRQGGPNGTEIPRVFLDDPRVEFVPAELPANKARLYFYPGRNQPLADGEYTLRVQGKDNKGNPAGRGNNYYEINFEVSSKSSITRVLNYPNPFSSSTRFVYTLTGSQLPELFQIHIYTVSGKLVKVVDLVALGEVNFGRNITSFAWDGTDEYGDRLANGVYLYKTVIKIPGQDMELRDEGVEQFFNKGWGKMYLMR